MRSGTNPCSARTCSIPIWMAPRVLPPAKTSAVSSCSSSSSWSAESSSAPDCSANHWAFDRLAWPTTKRRVRTRRTREATTNRPKTTAKRVVEAATVIGQRLSGVPMGNGSCDTHGPHCRHGYDGHPDGGTSTSGPGVPWRGRYQDRQDSPDDGGRGRGRHTWLL